MARITTTNTPIDDADLRQENTIQEGPSPVLEFDENGKYIPVVLTAVGKVQYRADKAGAAWSDTIPDGVLIAGEPVKFRIRASGVTPADNGTFRYDFLMATEGAGGLNLYNTGPNEAMIVGTTPADQVGKTFSVNVTVKDSIGTAKTGTALSKAWEAAPGTSIPVDSISVSPKTVSVEVGATSNISATVLPANATNKKVDWTSSDATIVTVDATGKIIGVKAGTASVHAAANDNGSKVDTTAVTVTAPAEATEPAAK